MTRQEFDSAVDSLQRNLAPTNDRERRAQARVVAAVCGVIKQRQGVPDDIDWTAPELTLDELREFFADISQRQRKLLKQIAEGLIMHEARIH
jgi:hypothetical protein